MYLFSYSLFQSLVLISKLPYVHLFHTMLKQIAPEYFEKSEAFLEAGSGTVMLFWKNLCNVMYFF